MGDDDRTQAPDHAGDDRSRGHSTGRDYGLTRRYSPVERAGLTWLAVRDGVTATADAHNVPRSTLTTWMEEAGGIGPVQEWLRTETAGRLLKFEQSMYDWAIKQVEGDRVNHEQAWVTIRKLIDARTGVLAAQGQDGQPPAVAAAQATVTLKIEEKDGGGDGDRPGAAPRGAGVSVRNIRRLVTPRGTAGAVAFA